MDIFRRTIRLIRLNQETLVLFELSFKAIVAAGFTLAASLLLRLVMRVMGLSYITRENFSALLRHPLTLGLLLLLTLLAVTCGMIDISAVVYTLNCSAQGFRCRLRQIVHFSLGNVRRMWQPGNLPLMALILLLTPFMGLSFIGGLLATVSLPEIVQEIIGLYPHLFIMGLAVVMLAALLLMPFIYTFHYFALEGLTFREAIRRSARLSRRRWMDYGVLLLVQAALTALMVLTLLALTLVGALLGRALGALFHRQWLTAAVVWYALALSLGIVFTFATPISYGCVSQLFYRHKQDTGEPVVPAYVPAYRLDRTREKMLATLSAAIQVVAIGSLLVVGGLVSTGALNPPVEELHTLEITAHRGASALYPENTMAAFRGARELGADWVELDVQQTLDGQIVVLHDPNTRRTTGVRGNVWNMTYEQISRLDAGSSFSRDFAGEPIPLLSEVAEYARDTGLRLNIELKPTGRETDFEASVIDIVREYGLESHCVITSQVYSVLENVKACDESIPTVYVTSLAYGSIDHLSAADHFSVQSNSVTARLVSRVHNQGHQIYAWTVNTKRGIERMIDRNVDNIITDNIELARQCVMESRYSPLVGELVQTLDEVLTEEESEPMPDSAA